MIGFGIALAVVLGLLVASAYWSNWQQPSRIHLLHHVLKLDPDGVATFCGRFGLPAEKLGWATCHACVDASKESLGHV